MKTEDQLTARYFGTYNRKRGVQQCQSATVPKLKVFNSAEN